MSTRRVGAVALFAALGALVVAPAATVAPASGAGVAPAAGTLPALASAPNASTASLGTHLAAFVNAGVESAGEKVEHRMWTAAYEASDNRSTRAALVAQRTDALETRLADLEAEKQRLVDRRRTGEIEPLVFQARMSALATRLSALRASINDTVPRAAAVGADPAAVRALDERARNASGPQLRQARSLGGGPPGGFPPGLAGGPSWGGDGTPVGTDALGADDCEVGSSDDADDQPDSGDGSGSDC